MGYAMAAVARQLGARVILISGPTRLAPPPGVDLIGVRTAEEMFREVVDRFDAADIIVKAAAVSDFRPARMSATKIKKSGEDMGLELARNRDILQTLGAMKQQKPNPPLLIGFAAESDNLLAYGREKLEKKNLDFIAINDITATDSGFGVDTNRVILLDKNGGQTDLPLLSKEETARAIWSRVIGKG
jgi:phosphopantothenoylcysteine decarboxylase/phosphopantothenate--cysteine ligase